ncbi:hypothetical protein C8R46DRAFT_964921 [Mycena filopes]|nr:hypothetical protein C8R46DRAFT_964921 [Mycena filopes]
MRLGLVNYYNANGPKVYLQHSQSTPGTEMLGSYAETYDYALLDGHRLTSTRRSKRNSAASSLIQVQFKGEAYVGEVREIFRHKQTGVPSSETSLLVLVAWMKPSKLTPLDNGSFVWNDFPELGVDTWQYNTYARPTDTDLDCPPFVIRLEKVQCQVARGKIGFTDPPLWITTTLDRFPTSLLGYGFGQTAETV